MLFFLTKHQLSGDSSAKINSELFYLRYHDVTIANIIIFVILLFVSNIMFIRQRYWDTFIWTGIIFLIFTLIDWWWLSNIIFEYKTINNLSEGESNFYPIIGVLIGLLGLGISIGNYYLLKQLFREKEDKSAETKINSTKP